jgi:hypothetical protein
MFQSCQKSVHWASKAQSWQDTLFSPWLWLIGDHGFMKEDSKKALPMPFSHPGARSDRLR